MTPRPDDSEPEDKGFMGKKPADTIGGMLEDFELARAALPEAWDEIRRMTADAIVKLDRKTGLENVTDANVATMIGAKAGITKGIWGGPWIGIKAAIAGGLLARLLVTSNVRDVRGWANEHCTPELIGKNGGSDIPTAFHGPPTSSGRYPMAATP